MGSDPSIHETTFQDFDGDTWTARQTIGIGVETMGEALGTVVEFTNVGSGLTLRGRVLGLAAAGIEELRRALDDAKRRHKAGLPSR